MFDNNTFTYKIFKDYNIIFDEKGSTCGTVRKVQWVKNDNEPDESKAKIEIRKIYTSGEEEKTGKGYVFSTEEGPGELAVGLINAGFGNTKDILRGIVKRDDFKHAVETFNDNNEGSDTGEMFDMRDLLLNLSNEEMGDE